jgi:hypothetical protein
MRPLVLAAFMMTAIASAAWAAEPEPAKAPASIRARLDEDAIRKAVRATLAETPATAKDRGPVLRGDAYNRFERQFDDARLPSCWQPDAMKHQPPHVGPIALGGILALPFWGAAIVTGKCK